MRMKSIGCALLLGLAIPVAAQAQTTGRITGVVTSDAGRPIPFAQIGAVSGPYRAITDTAGRYRILNVPAGRHVIRAASLGHSAQVDTVNVTAGGETTLNFTLPVIAASL